MIAGMFQGLAAASLVLLQSLTAPALAQVGGESQTVDNVVIYLGLMPAEMIRGHPAEHAESSMHGVPAPASGQYHVLIALFDAKSGARITGASVTARVSEVGLVGPEKTLEPMEIAGTETYGNYFPMAVNRFGVAAVAAALSLGSVAGLAQTWTPAQSDQNEAGPGFGPMMGGWGRGPMGMMGYGMGPWMMGAGDLGPQMCAMMASHVDGRLAYLKAKLKITDAQEPLWKDYAAAVRDKAKGMLAHCTAATMGSREGAGLSLTDQMDWHEQFLSAQPDAVRAANKALKPLYAAFSDEQKKTADQMFWGPMGMM